MSAATLPRGFGRSDAVGYRWADSAWVETWKLGYGTLLFWPVLAPRGETHLIWQGVTPETSRLLMISELVGDSLARPDTIVHTNAEVRIEYSAAVGKSRRWAAVSDRIKGLTLRVFFSDRRGPWQEVPASGGAGSGVTVGEVNDTTALVVWADEREVRWGLLRGRAWEPRGTLWSEQYSILRPRLRKIPGGGFWLTWGTYDPDIRLAAYKNGVWSDPVAITGAYPEPHGQHSAMDTDMSRDDAEHPVIAWDTDSPITDGVIAVSVPVAGAYPVGEVVPGSRGGVLPSVVRDANGDVWISWWEEFRATWWTHTYTRATATDVRLTHGGRRRTLSWAFSEPAPDSWWTVLRSRGEGPFEEAARVQAGAGLEVSWTDDSPPRGGRHRGAAEELEPDHGQRRIEIRYKIRRDCLATRYQWESEEVAWPPGVAHGPSPPRHWPRLKPPLRPWRGDALLEVADAAPGAVQVTLYDLQGREMMSERVERSAAGGLRFPLDRAREPLRSGVYFARVRDAAGAESNAVRLVVLR